MSTSPPGNAPRAARITVSPRRFFLARWFDGRAVLLAIAVAAAVSFPRWSGVTDRRDEYYLDVTLTSTASGATRLLWDNGRGFNEHDSSVQPLAATREPVRYRFLLPYGRINRLRLAVIDQAAEITVSDPRIFGPHRKLVHRFTAADLLPGRGYADVRRQAEGVSARTEGAGAEAYLALRLAEPLRLPVTARTLARLIPPIAIVVFGLGLLLASPLARRAGEKLQPVVAWCRMHPRSTLALVSAAVVLWQAHPVVFQGRSFVSPANGSLMLYGDLPTLPGSKQRVYADGLSSDTGAMLFQHLYYPMIEWSALVRDHELPLWNRSSLCGLPLLGQGQSMTGDPLNLLTILTRGASWAWDIRFLVARWLLAFGLAIVAWQYTRYLPAALLTAIGAGFLGYFAYRLIHPANFSVAYAPWLLVAWLALAQAGTRARENWALGLLLVAHGIEFCSGTIKEAVVLIVMLDFAGLLLLWLWPETGAARRRRIVRAGLTLGLFVLLAAPFWMSFLVALRHSYTGYDQPLANQLPVGELIGLFDDIFYRQNTPEEAVVAPALNFLFFGGFLVWLAWPGVGFRRSAGLAITAAVCVAIGFDVVPARWIEAVPFLGNIQHVGNEFSCVLLIVLVPLAARGFQLAAASAAAPYWWRRCVLAAAVGGVAVVSWYLDPARVGLTPFAASCIGQLAVGLVGLALAVRWWGTGRSRAGLWIAWTLALPLLLWRYGQYGGSDYNHYVFVPGERVDVHAVSPAVQAVDARRTEPTRVIGFGNHLFPGYAGALDWETLYGVDALRSRHYYELAQALRIERVWRWELPDAESDATAMQPAQDALNVRFALADHSAEPRSLGRRLRVAAADLDVYESPTAWPRAFFTDRVARYRSVDDFAQLINHGDGRPFAAVQPGEPDVPAIPAETAGRTIRAATDYRLTANTTRFMIDAPGPGIAVLTEAYYPNDFRVRLDGRPVGYFRVNHAFKGVAIPSAGRHEVVMTYWPEHFSQALLLCAVGAGLCGLAIVRLVREARRETACSG
jgi:hypothetical protein